MAKRSQTPMMRKLLNETERCELCGSRRDIEVHHIIPVCCGGPEDDINNMVVVCRKCHQILTPHSTLTKIGIEKKRFESVFDNLKYKFYHTLDEMMDFDGCDPLETNEILNVFDNLIEEFKKGVII